MRREKIIAAALAMTLSMGNTVFATETAGPAPENRTAEIKATYSEEIPEPEITYNVEVTWGSLEYVYSSGITQKWNSNTLKFEMTDGTAAWSCALGADQIKITNNSNTAITAALAYSQTDSSVSGSFDQSKINLGTAEGTAAGAGPSGTATLTLGGDLSDPAAARKAVGNVTVTIGDFAGEPADTSIISGTYNAFRTTGSDNIYVSEGQRGAKGYVIGFDGRELRENYYVPLNGLTIKGTTYYIALTKDEAKLTSGVPLSFGLTTDSSGEYVFELPRSEVTYGASFHYTITINIDTLTGTVLITPVD